MVAQRGDAGRTAGSLTHVDSKSSLISTTPRRSDTCSVSTRRSAIWAGSERCSDLHVCRQDSSRCAHQREGHGAVAVFFQQVRECVTQRFGEYLRRQSSVSFLQHDINTFRQAPDMFIANCCSVTSDALTPSCTSDRVDGDQLRQYHPVAVDPVAGPCSRGPPAAVP